MKHLRHPFTLAAGLAWIALGSAVVLAGCGSRTARTGAGGSSTAAAPAGHVDPHMPPAGVAGQAALNQQQQAAAAAYTAEVRQAQQAHKK